MSVESNGRTGARFLASLLTPPVWLRLVLPLVALLVVVIVAPVVSSIVRSFQPYLGPLHIDTSRLTLDNYRAVFGTPYYRAAFARTISVSAITVVACGLLAYPAAIFIAGLGPSWRAPVLLVFISPELVSAVVRAYGWIIILNPTGPIDAALLRLGIVHTPVLLIRNEVGIVIGLVQVLLPFMLLPIFAALVNIDKGLALAAKNLGASDVLVFLRITFPLSLPGVLAGVALVFTLAMAQYVVPSLLGGSQVPVLAELAYDQTITFLNWPLGSALGMVLLFAALVVVLVTDRVARFAGSDARE